MITVDPSQYSSAVATIIGVIFTGFLTVNTFFFKWLVDRFDKLACAIKDINDTTQIWLRDHEEKDQERHIENLYRFENISVSLAKLK